MIEINLVPKALRKKKRSQSLANTLTLPKEMIIGIVFGFAGLLFIADVLVLGIVLVKAVQLKRLNKEMALMTTEKNNVDRDIQQLRTLQGKIKAIDEITSMHWTQWAPKLNEISNSIPRGAWLTKVALDGDTLVLQGSAVSKSNTEMINVHNFTANLKNSALFMEDFTNVELGSIKSRKINLTPVADFTITAEMKKTEKKKK